MREQLKNIEARAKEELSKVSDPKLLEELRVKFLGKKGEITAILKQMGKLSAEERPVIGQLANSVRADIESAIAGKQAQLKEAMAEKSLRLKLLTLPCPEKLLKSAGLTRLMQSWRRLRTFFSAWALI